MLNKDMANGQNVGLKTLSSALRVIGADCSRFLAGMLTQDMSRAFEEKDPTAGRAFFLTAKGKIIAPVFFYKISEGEVILWSYKKSLAAFLENISKFLVADKVELQPLGEFESWTLVESTFSFEALKNRHPLGNEKIFKLSAHENYLIAPQARLSSTHVEVLCFKNISLTAIASPLELTSEKFWQYHFDSGQAWWGNDLFEDDFFLEFPLQDSVSFDKGCYRGQETVARGTFRGKVNKSFAKIKSDKELSVGEILSKAGEKLGQLRSFQNTQGLGIVKFEHEAKSRSHFDALINGEAHSLNVEWLVNERTFRGER